MKKLLSLLFIFFIGIPAFANDVYIERIWTKFGLYEDLPWKNKAVLPAKYDDIIRHFYNLFTIVKDNKCGLFDANRSLMVLPIEYDDIEACFRALKNYVVKVKKDNKYGLFDYKRQQFVLPIEYDLINTDVIQDIFLIKKGKYYGVYDAISQEIQVPVIYENIEIYSNDFIAINVNNKWGVYDKHKNKMIIEPKFNEIWFRCYRYFIVKKNNKFGLYESDKLILPIKYDYINTCTKYLFVFKENNKYGLYRIDKNSKGTIYEPQFDKVTSFFERTGRLVRLTKNGLTGVYNAESGKFILPIEYSYISNKNFSSLIIQKNNLFGLFDFDDEKNLLPIEYDLIEPIENTFYLKLKKNNKYGVYDDKKQEIIIPVAKDSITYNSKNNKKCAREPIINRIIYMIIRPMIIKANSEDY